MSGTLAITALSGVFPGVEGPASVEQFAKHVACAQPARLRRIKESSGLPRESYFHPVAGTPYRTYLDSAYTISSDPPARQLDLGKQVLRDLFASVTGTPMPASERTGLCLATMWTEPDYYSEDCRRVLGEGFSVDGSFSDAYGPGEQLDKLANAAAIAGPTLGMDTACASSLYAVDAAIGLIESGRADAVAVMGLNANLPLFMFLGFAKLRALSPNAEILPFAANASGLIPSEAVAAILLEPVDQALRSGRKPLALIRGLGLSADGGDRSIFAPSPDGQYLAYERAYTGIDPATIGYIEAHGTATVLGDRTELEVLDRYFSPHQKQTKLPIGSVKALIGHALAAAGMASIVKALLMMRDQMIPPHIPVQPNARIENSCLRLPVRRETWHERDGVHRIGISSFGFGGANAHIVLERFTPSSAIGSQQRLFPSIAIVAAEATVGAAHGCTEVSRRMADGNPAWTPFPWQRFSEKFAGGQARGPEGNFFPEHLTVEGAGLRMGPSALERVDSFQRLGIDLARRVLDAQAYPAPLQETAVAFCSNLGGAISLHFARHYQARFAGRSEAGGPLRGGEPSVESIASSLSSLASGFVAYHHGIKGFHQTISGGSASFWEALSLAPYWLDCRSKALILAAGRQVKSPVDIDEAVQPGEGIIVFLLKTLEECTRTGETPLATIRFSSTSLEPVEISQLEASADRKTRGTAQQACGFLDEATGAESLLHVLLKTGTGVRTIEIRRGTQVKDRLVVEKLREFVPQQLTFAQRLKIEFQTADRSGGEFLAWQRATELALLSFFDAQRTLLKPPAAPTTQRRAKLTRDPKNIVLDSPRVEAGEAGANLKVDETHPYFFDHALDHVPGILILEGILQLIELMSPEAQHLSGIDLSFKRFCEKHRPISIRATPVGKRRFSIVVMQDGVEAARCEIETSTISESETKTGKATARAQAVPRALVHKAYAENVLIGAIHDLIPGLSYRCDLLPPPSGHILDEGPPSSFLPLYVFETSRQFVMVIAHELQKIPLGLPINLISIRLRMDQPAPRGEPLHFECVRQPVRRLGSMTLADLTVELHRPNGKIGDITIKAQVVDEATYSKQRGLV